MRPDLATMIERVARVREQAASGAAVPSQIEDVLSEGYAWALIGDEWSIRTEERLHELISDPLVTGRGPALRALASEHTGFQRGLIELRRELAELRRDRDRLRAGLRAASS